MRESALSGGGGQAYGRVLIAGAKELFLVGASVVSEAHALPGLRVDPY